MCLVRFRHEDILFMLNMCTGEMSAASRGLSPHYTAQHTQHAAVGGTAALTLIIDLLTVRSVTGGRELNTFTEEILNDGMMSQSHKLVLID